MLTLYFILAAVGGYLLGSVPFGLVLVRAAGLGDIRSIGSGNIGATNVLRTGRKDLALATLVLDAGKAGIALFLARLIAGAENPLQIEFGLVAGFAAFIGHCYPVWLKFSGGKGVATYFGLLLVGMPPLGVVIGITWLAVAMMFRISSLAALASVTLAPVLALVGGYSPAEIVCLVALAALIFWRHKTNIARIRAGTEPRMGEKKKDDEEASAATAKPAPAPAVTESATAEPSPPAEPTPDA
ncbi:MAG: glycerol-3-phosphate 1-O-acyltransferase PlsY [Hyphomonadaceae bacterium]|nr:glycerol-3-phosphate 1-O-acyltransferase PlsY [Hyphomonadaceae bacterium]